MIGIRSRREILEILRRYGQSQDKMGHVQAVADLALTTADRLRKDGIEVNKSILEAGALLHDIGLTRTSARTEEEEAQNPMPEHAVYGAQIVLDLGFPKEVAECVQGHECTGMTLEEGKELGLPPPVVGSDYAPRSIEGKLVIFSDAMIFMVVHLKGQFDPWKDPEAPAEACRRYASRLYQNRTGRSITTDHPICRRAVKYVGQFIRYIGRRDVPPPWPGMTEIPNPR